MPGRALAGATREGFTTKERDGETGLDYFGARYYMAALGRWTTVDPPADEFPEWSPYNYVENKPMILWDPDGLCPRWAGGDGEGSGLEDCPEGSVGWRVHQAEQRFSEMVQAGSSFVENNPQCVADIGGFALATLGTASFAYAGVRVAAATARSYGQGLVARGLARDRVQGLEGMVQRSISASHAHFSAAGTETAVLIGVQAEGLAGIQGQMATKDSDGLSGLIFDILPVTSMFRAGERVAASCR
jgi:RHS repeat-associated protein